MEKIKGTFKGMVVDSGDVGQEFQDFINHTTEKSGLDPKAHQFACIAFLTVKEVAMGVSSHTKIAKQLGATKDEIRGIFFAGMPIMGVKISDYYKIAMDAYDED